METTHVLDREDKLIYICEFMDEMNVDQRRECYQQVILARENFDEKTVKETGEGLMIPTSHLDDQTVSTLYTHIKQKLDVNEEP